jgi:hypothetical protein
MKTRPWPGFLILLPLFPWYNFISINQHLYYMFQGLILIEELKKIIQDNPHGYNSHVRNNERLFSFISKYPGANIAEMSYNAIHNNTKTEYFCGTCNVQMTKPFLSFKDGYRKWCNYSCGAKSKEVQDKRKSTSKERYGVEVATQSKVFQDKIKQTNLERYGVEYPATLESIKDKIKQTNLERYGCESPLQNKDVQEAIKKTNLEKYGCENPLQSEEIKDKIKQTNIEKYGFENPNKNSEVRAKLNQTVKERYGVDNVMEIESVRERQKATNLERFGYTSASQNDEVKQKIIETNLERYGVERPATLDIVKEKGKQTKIEKYGTESASALLVRTKSIVSGELYNRLSFLKEKYQVERLFTDDDYINNNPLRWKHVCGVEYESKLLNGYQLLSCPNTACKKQSLPQRAIYEHVCSLVGKENIVVNDRSVLKPYELDIYIPSKNLAIEMDGVYWHQREESIDKQEACKEQGIQLIHITDLSWYEHTEVWKSIIASKLKCQETMYARKCEVKMISIQATNDFLNSNHLQGEVKGTKVSIGLYHESELVAVMTFGKPRFNKNYEWELLRYASKLNVTVVGGAGKLLKYFKSMFSGSIITYAKKEYSDGGLYKTLGFSMIEEGVKSYFYIHKTTNEKVSRLQAQKHKLPELLGEQYDEVLTEKENMKQANYFLVWDKGSYTFGMV